MQRQYELNAFYLLGCINRGKINLRSLPAHQYGIGSNVIICYIYADIKIIKCVVSEIGRASCRERV